MKLGSQSNFQVKKIRSPLHIAIGANGNILKEILCEIAQSMLLMLGV